MGNELSLKAAAGAIVKAADVEGLEGISQSELSIRPPQVKIVQAMRGEDIAGRRDLFEGDLYDSSSTEKIGDKDAPVRLIFCALWHQFIEWEGTGAEATVLRATNNAADDWVIGRTKPTKGPSGWEKPPVTKYIRGLAIRPGHSMPCLISFSKSSLQCGEQIIQATRSRGGALWDRAWDITTKQMKNPANAGTYYIFQATPVGEAVPEEFKTMAREFSKQYESLRREAQAEASDA